MTTKTIRLTTGDPVDLRVALGTPASADGMVAAVPIPYWHRAPWWMQNTGSATVYHTTAADAASARNGDWHSLAPGRAVKVNLADSALNPQVFVKCGTGKRCKITCTRGAYFAWPS